MRILIRLCPPLLILAIIWGYNFYQNYCLRSYGLAYNLERRKIGIPPVGADWEEVLLSNEISFVNPSTRGPRHERKRVILGERMLKEADLFYLPGNKGTIDLIFEGSVENSQATLYPDTGLTIKMPYSQALDTLRKYHLLDQ